MCSPTFEFSYCVFAYLIVHVYLCEWFDNIFFCLLMLNCIMCVYLCKFVNCVFAYLILYMCV
jgi:hypothetical protein